MSTITSAMIGASLTAALILTGAHVITDTEADTLIAQAETPFDLTNPEIDQAGLRDIVNIAEYIWSGDMTGDELSTHLAAAAGNDADLNNLAAQLDPDQSGIHYTDTQIEQALTDAGLTTAILDTIPGLTDLVTVTDYAWSGQMTVDEVCTGFNTVNGPEADGLKAALGCTPGQTVRHDTTAFEKALEAVGL